MLNFVYHNPTKLIFGRGVQTQVGAEARLWAGDQAKAVIVSGGQSARRSGLLGAVEESCRAAGVPFVEFSGVHPNPTMEEVRALVALAKKEQATIFIAVGGGSVIDCAKAACVGVPYEGDAWDFFSGKAQPKSALPVLAVLTIPAAGSEQSIRAVVTEGDVKTGIGCPLIRPKAAFINPELFFTLPDHQVSAGVFDMMSHIMERYFTNTPALDYVSAQAEAALRTIMANGLKVMAKRDDYDAWAQVGLAGSFAHNGYFGLGCVEDWACHGIEHALSGWDTKITHGWGLAVITPAWMKHVWKTNPGRFLRFATEVMGVDVESGTPEAVIAEGIARLEYFVGELKMPHHLSDLHEGPIDIDEIAHLATARGPLGHFQALTFDDVKAILQSCL